MRKTLSNGFSSQLRKAVDEQDAGEWTEARNKSLAKALAQVMDVDVPDTLVTNQAREKYAQMMAEFRTQGMEDEEIKKLITPENFQKYKEIQKPDIVDDFKTSMATDEIARIEGIEVPSYQIDEQLEAVKKEAAGEDLGDENMLRSKIESTIMRRMVFDFLADSADLDVNYSEDKFDEKVMEELAQESLAREEGAQGESKDEDTSTATLVDEEEEDAEGDDLEVEQVAEAAAAEVAAFEAEAATDIEAAPNTEIDTPEETPEEKDARYLAMDPEERAFNSLLESGLVSLTPDPESSDYDNSEDDELAVQNVIQ